MNLPSPLLKQLRAMNAPGQPLTPGVDEPMIRVQSKEEYARMMDYFEGCGDARRVGVLNGDLAGNGKAFEDRNGGAK